MSPKQDELVSGKFQCLVFSPKGSVEGVLLDVEGEVAQIVFERGDEAAPLAFETLKKGHDVVVRAMRQGKSPKGESPHDVLACVRLVSIDGRKPAKTKAVKAAAFSGTVMRFNFARHGEANGVVLDSGDFIHTKPPGLGPLKLSVGSKVRADGPSRPLRVGGGMVVEAAWVNGKRIRA